MELTDVIGDFGPFQRRILFMLFMRGLVVAFFILITTVFIPPLKYHCASDYFQFQQNGSDHEQQCSYYDGNETVFCDRWEYESTDGKTTLNMEFDLVCDRKWLESLIHFIYFSGNFAAFIPGGYLADRMNTAFIYYFFHLNTANFEVALYLSVILLGVIQTLSTLVYLLMAKFLSRTRSIFINCCVAGLVFLSVVAIPSDERFLWAPLTLALIGNISLSLNFAFLWIIGAELLPTSVRNSGIDVGWALGRTTSMVAPFFVQLWSHTGLSPLIFVGIYSLAAGVIAFFLPETKDQNLMDTISEAKKHFLRANKEVAEEETPV